MNQLRPLRQEFVPDADAFEATHTGQLGWLDLVRDLVGERIDRLTYTTEAGTTEYVLSVQGSMGTHLTYFAVQFSHEEALAFVQEQSETLMERLRKRRQQESDDFRSQRGQED